MRLAPRLVLAFALLSGASVAGLGYLVREDRREQETHRFDQEVKSVCQRAANAILRQAETDQKLIAGACQSGELVDRTLVEIESGNLDARRFALAALVPKERDAFGLDELVLATDVDVLGADPRTLLSIPKETVAAALAFPSNFRLRTAGSAVPATLSHCKRTSQKRAVLLLGARHLAPYLDQLGGTLDAKVSIAKTFPRLKDTAESSCEISDGASALTLHVSKSRRELFDNLRQIDRTIVFAAALSTFVALIVGAVLARRLGRPLEELAVEARKVATGEARPLKVSGTDEIAALASAFDRMLEDLEATRRRLAATSRVAAWREVARRVAHEIKNPLAPIQAAVETLRRLRARNDPAFDDYFDEATRTVLGEVHRISNIVTEFTRFARLPPPHPEPCELMELVRDIVGMQQKTAPEVAIHVRVERVPPVVRADRGQLVQVLTNLVQNAIEAVRGKDKPRIEVVLSSHSDAATITVSDNGPGIPIEIAAHLFEPYTTTKEHGTGLGLAIAQRIALEHAGELALLASEIETGATFRLTLPIEGPAPTSDL